MMLVAYSAASSPSSVELIAASQSALRAGQCDDAKKYLFTIPEAEREEDLGLLGLEAKIAECNNDMDRELEVLIKIISREPSPAAMQRLGDLRRMIDKRNAEAEARRIQREVEIKAQKIQREEKEKQGKIDADNAKRRADQRAKAAREKWQQKVAAAPGLRDRYKAEAAERYSAADSVDTQYKIFTIGGGLVMVAGMGALGLGIIGLESDSPLAIPMIIGGLIGAAVGGTPLFLASDAGNRAPEIRAEAEEFERRAAEQQAVLDQAGVSGEG